MFRDLHRPGDPLLLPNAWDHASAAAFVAAGHRAVGTTSLGVAAAAGLPDGAGVTREATVALALGLARGGIVVSADIEGGFSDDPAEVGELCAELSEAGVVGVNLEDGRADGSLRGASDHAAVIAAAVTAAPDLFVNARTDTAWLGAGDLDETIRRVSAYADAGASGVFVPGLGAAADIERVVQATPLPLNVLLSPAGPTLAELGALGVARISTGSLLFRIALGSALDALKAAAGSETVDRFQAIAYDDVQALAPPPV